MLPRDRAETLLRQWNAYEGANGGEAVIDFDCAPPEDKIEPATDRLSVYRQLTELRDTAPAAIATRLDADIAYLGAVLGERPSLDRYVRRTQGCAAAGWPEEYVEERGTLARTALESVGVGWGPETRDQLDRVEEPLASDDAPSAIKSAARELEPVVRRATGADAEYKLTIETTTTDAYWSFWTDGRGHDVRVRLNLRNLHFTKVQARQFALHEVLGHGLQSVSYTARSEASEVPWVRIMSVHAPHQVLLEGLAQAAPLFVTPDDKQLAAAVKLAHYDHLVLSRVHRAINNGSTVAECAEYMRSRLPWRSDESIARDLADRGADPCLRSYMWAYVAGIDWFVALAEHAPSETIREVLHAAYQTPLTPRDLAQLWPTGPAIGGPGGAMGLRNAPVERGDTSAAPA